MTSNRKLAIALILSASLFVVLFFVWTNYLAVNQIGNPDNKASITLKTPSHAFPSRISNRISIPAQGSSEEGRIEYYDSDGITLLIREITYKNGVTSYIYFRRNKLAEKMEEFYPIEDGSLERVLKTRVIFEDDGILFARHQSWRPDKTLIKEGARLSDGTYRTTTYFADGVTKARVQNFTRRRDMTDETVYRKDGVKARVTLVARNGEHQITVYRNDKKSEVTYMTMDISRSQYHGATGKVYSDDGQIVIAEFQSGSFKTEFTFLHTDGKPRLLVRYERTVTGHLTVDTYVHDAQVKFRQVYLKHSESVHGCSGSYALSYVDEFAADNSQLGKSPFRRIFLSDDEKTVKAVAIPDQNYYYMGKGTTYELYPSGFVAKKRIFSKRDVSSDTVYPDKQYREPAATVTDRSIFKRADFECPGPLPVWNQDLRSWILE